jgi:translation initiation factor IF-2
MPGVAVHHGPRPAPAPGAVPGLVARSGQAQGSASPTPGVDPRAMRPTATQAVVISRPLIPVRRVTPPSSTYKNIPMAPGKRAIGEVREFKVVPDSLGRGREFIDVTKDKAGKARRSRSGPQKELSKQELIDLASGRTHLPIGGGRARKKRPTKKGARTLITTPKESKRVIRVEEAISVSDLSQRMGAKATELIRKLMKLGVTASINQSIDVTTAQLLATDYGYTVEKAGFEEAEFIQEVEDRPEDLKPRPPVVTIMGHVDHGKTSLLDAIRKSNVAEGEAGGITQHIGAYSVNTAKGPITFLDTPGHEAFTAMRARGAQVTDVAVLVVAADDGVMPQTVESINHAKAAEVPIVVAINKVDKPGTNPDRVKQMLSDHGLVPEDWGGETIMVPVSAKTKQNLEQLLENIALQAEILELRSNPSRDADGAVIEAKLEKGRGPVATVLVQDGTLRLGDAVVSGTNFGRIRAMTDFRGKPVKEVAPGYCAEIVGLSGAPSAGDEFNVVKDVKTAEEIAKNRELKERQKEAAKTAKVSIEELFARVKKPAAKELRVVLKADVQGSVEAVANALQQLSTAKVKVNILHKAVGAVTENDVNLAKASGALIVGFNSKTESKVTEVANRYGIQILTFNIIYEAVDAVRAAMEGLLDVILRERALGRAEVRNLFSVPRVGVIAGSAVLDGKVNRGAQVRVIREKKALFTGKITSLKRFKDDVKEVASGFECGIGIENFNELKVGDVLEVFDIEQIRQSL